MDLIYRFDPFRPIDVSRPASPEAAVAAPLDGNRRLVDLVQKMQRATIDGNASAEPTIVAVDLFSLGLPFWPGMARDQAPFALVLGCADARVPIEAVFDQSFNDLFVVRVAGNVLSTDAMGSFDYAVRALDQALQAAVVLGHTGCGAVTAAVDAYLSPNHFADIAFTHSLRMLIDRVMISVRAVASALDGQFGHEIHRHAGYRAAMIEAAVYLNAAVTAFDLEREIRSRSDSSIGVFYSVCDIDTLLVGGMPSSPGTANSQLQPAPRHAQDFHALTSEIVKRVGAKLFR